MTDYHGGTGNDVVLHWAYQKIFVWAEGPYGSAPSPAKPLDISGTEGLANEYVIAVSSGESHSVMLCLDGDIYERNNPYRNDSEKIVDSGILAGKKVIQISAGADHTLALCSDGTLVAWGGNGSGQLGTGTLTSSIVPARVIDTGALSGKQVISISAGYHHSLALCSDGTVLSWGLNIRGELGVGDLNNRSEPVMVDLSGVIAGRQVVTVTAGHFFSLAVFSDGTVAAWGDNRWGQLGGNGTTDSAVPVLVDHSGALAGRHVVEVSASSDHVVARCSNGALICWGGNYVGQLGNNTTANVSLPTLVDASGTLSGKDVISGQAGNGHSFALCSDGTLVAWGFNLQGEFGDGGTTSSLVPVIVNSTGALAGMKAVSVSSRYTRSIARLAVPLANDSQLAALSINQGTMEYGISSRSVDYRACVSEQTTAITLNPTVNHPLAGVTVNGSPVASGSASPLISLGAGTNVIELVVTAENGSSTAYSLTVIRSSDVHAVFSGVSNVGVSYPAFDATGLQVDFSLDFAPPAGTNLMVVNATGLGFIKGRFTNLLQGQKVGLSHNGLVYPFVANYFGGSGNDLVLEWAYQNVYSWGKNNNSQLGDGSSSIYTTTGPPVMVSNAGILSTKTIREISAGSVHSMALCTDGTIATWGDNSYGLLGDGTATTRPSPVAVAMTGGLAGKEVAHITAGISRCYAVCSDGRIVSWGFNGFGFPWDDPIPPVELGTDGVLANKLVVAVAAGNTHTLALCSDGKVVAWGDNSYGQLGDGSFESRSKPVEVDASGALLGKIVIAVDAGLESSVALCSDGTVVTWGRGKTVLGRNVPVELPVTSELSGKTVVGIAAGYSHIILIYSDGTVATWEFDTNQLVDGGGNPILNPVIVSNSGALSGRTAVEVEAGGAFSLARCSDGVVVGWGGNNYGQYGPTQSGSVMIPTLIDQSGVLAGKKVIAMAGGYDHSLILAATSLSSDSKLAALTLSQGGFDRPFNGDVTNYECSVSRAAESINLVATVRHPLAKVAVNGAPVGSGNVGVEIPIQTGASIIKIRVTAESGDSTDYTLQISRPDDLSVTFVSHANSGISVPAFDASGLNVNLSLAFDPSIASDLVVVNNTGTGSISGRFNNLAQGQLVELFWNGRTYRFLANYFGGTGNDIVLQWARRSLSSWGLNGGGQLGNSNVFSSRVPVPVDQSEFFSGKTVVGISLGDNHSLAVMSDGTVAAWGLNNFGQLGNNSFVDSRVPMKVEHTGVLLGRSVVAVAAGSKYSAALCSDGKVVVWGRNNHGQLGNESAVQSNEVPVDVSVTGVLAGKTVVAISSGELHMLALCSDGTIVSWGANSSGQLGNNGTAFPSNVPVLVSDTGGLAGKTPILIAAGGRHSMALCSDGMIASWGGNDNGQLGNNSTSFRFKVPTLIPTTGLLSGKNIVAIAAGSKHSFALCSEGLLVAWGSNSMGQLGNNSTSLSRTPVAVSTAGVLSDQSVVAISAGSESSMALCSSGRLVTWGNNVSGQLGAGLYDRQSRIPVTVIDSGELYGKKIIAIACGRHHSVVLSSVPDHGYIDWMSGQSGLAVCRT